MLDDDCFASWEHQQHGTHVHTYTPGTMGSSWPVKEIKIVATRAVLYYQEPVPRNSSPVVTS